MGGEWLRIPLAEAKAATPRCKHHPDTAPEFGPCAWGSMCPLPRLPGADQPE